MGRDTRVLLIGALCVLVTLVMLVSGVSFVSRRFRATQRVEMPKLQDFARRYTEAWCSLKASSVADFYEPEGSLIINNGVPAKGRAAITASVQSFMTAFPDLYVRMNGVDVLPFGMAAYHWTLTGTNTGPGGTGKLVHIKGFEIWHFGTDGLIVLSNGNYDEAEYKRQLERGAPEGD